MDSHALLGRAFPPTANHFFSGPISLLTTTGLLKAGAAGGSDQPLDLCIDMELDPQSPTGSDSELCPQPALLPMDEGHAEDAHGEAVVFVGPELLALLEQEVAAVRKGMARARSTSPCFLAFSVGGCRHSTSVPRRESLGVMRDISATHSPPLPVARSVPGTRRGAMVPCRLCPFRGFPQEDRLRHHVIAYHTERKQFCCSGTKQLKARNCQRCSAAALPCLPCGVCNCLTNHSQCFALWQC